MGQPRARSQPVVVFADTSPTITSDSAPALLRLLRELIDVQSKADGPKDEAVVAS